jgi:hypothetical protein
MQKLSAKIKLYHGTTLDKDIIIKNGLEPRDCADIIDELKRNLKTDTVPAEIEKEILAHCIAINDKYEPVPVSLTDDFKQAAGYARSALRHSGGKGGGEKLTLARECICTDDTFENFRIKHNPDCRMDHEIPTDEKRAKAKVVTIELPISELDQHWQDHFKRMDTLNKKDIQLRHRQRFQE